MTDKQIIIDYKTLCENYSKEVGCYNTFDGRCNKEQCFTYKLLQLLQDKEQECEELEQKIANYCFDCDVAERMRKVTYAVTGGRLSYANYTVEAIEQAYDDQLRIDVEYRTKELEEQLDQFKAQLLDQEAETLKAGGIIYALNQTLIEIKEIAEKEVNTRMLFADKESFCDFNKILQKVSEAIQDEN